MGPRRRLFTRFPHGALVSSDKKVVVRFSEELHDLALQLQKQHGATDVSDYLRGLVVADAAREGRLIRGISIPAWVVGERIHLTSDKTKEQHDSPKAPAAKR
jgi:hypothetical protein